MRIEDLEQSLRHIATLDETDDHLITAVLDCTGVRSAIRQRLQQRIRPVLTDLPADRRHSLDEARTRIERWIDDDLAADTRGAVVYARGGGDPVFLPLEFRVEMSREAVVVDTLPSVYDLCALKDAFHRYVVLLCTEDSMRILEVHLGAVTRQIWKERPEIRRRVGREWTREHYRNHRRDRTQRFVKEMIGVLEARTDTGGYQHLVLAGVPRLLAQVRDALPGRLREIVIDQLPASGRTSVEDVVTATLSTFVEEEQRESLSLVDALFDALYRDGLAVVGARRCLAALEHDQADLLIMAHDYDTDGREPILRAAQRRGCTVEFVGGNDRLDRVGGVGCLLRYRPPSMTLDSLELRTVEGGN